MPPSNIGPEIRAAAMADLLAGEQPIVVADRYGLPGATVRDWKRNIKAGRGMGAAINPIHPTSDPTHPTPVKKPAIETQQRQIGAIILDLLQAKLEASAAIARHATDNPAWLAQQPASELAAFGQWLDSTALAIGDRLAAAHRPADDGSAEQPDAADGDGSARDL